MRCARSLSGKRNDSYDDLDFCYDRGAEDDFEDEFVITQRRYKNRAAAAFEEDLAELRRKRRDMQDRIFDVIDLNAEIEKARTTLEAADFAFQRHATKFDNTEAMEREDMSLTEKLDRSRKIASIDATPEKPVAKGYRWVKVPTVDVDQCLPQPTRGRQAKMTMIDAAEITDPLDTLALQPLKRKFSKRKKNVSF